MGHLPRLHAAWLIGILCLGCHAFAMQQKISSHTIQWRTTSQEQIFGFNVYRATVKGGPFTKLNATLIRSKQGQGTQQYSYEDANIDPTRDYYYFVESISLDGIRERFTSLIHKTAVAQSD